jgi:DNA-binding YbaB/EbfC family protein
VFHYTHIIHMFNKLKQFKDLRDQAKEWQEKLGKESVSAQGAGGKVVMTMDGNLTMTGLAIDDELLAVEMKEKLQSGIKEAHKEAMKKIQQIMAMKMKEMGGLPNIPGMN